MKKEELKFRRNIILAAIFLLVLFTGIIAVNFLDGDLVWIFYPSFVIGVLFGTTTCIYLSEIWDPGILALKKSPGNTSSKKISWWWGPPLGVLVGNIIAQFLGSGFRNLFMGLFIGWLYIVLGYIIVEVWRHRPR